MQFIKFSFLLVLLSLSTAHSLERFTSKECLNANYKIKIKRAGMLFGLIKNNLTIEKQGCLISLKKDKLIPVQWNIDVCREPVHLKKESKVSGQEVIKKKKTCTENPDDDFCEYTKDVLGIMQDDGLIFASGDRDRLESDHGKTYCSFLLMKHYLRKDEVFSRYQEEVINLFGKESEVSTPKPSLPSESPALPSPAEVPTTNGNF